ncbi:hypothetical protein [Halobaculum magnesiiphilum]|uniref:Uncharacterized protein n=1 Tax=Halobaculum magnesiiphilum TaxID=1017351 RepID=A0A8T8W981_9EURY|nr:hypothetical protein [Halobaculum magnesiiphilum]QZP36381.1 hypothetical protein K6T50_08530 [Halobaculum magnesiiphilum]
MVSQSTQRLVAVALLAFAVGAVVGPSVNALPGFSDHTGPSELRVTEFERLDAGCAEDVATYSSGSFDAGNYSQVDFIETGDTDANLSAWTERTSPPGTDLSTFRVHVDSRHEGPTNASCETGVLYRITVTPSGGSPEGLIPDAHGTRIQWMENGEFAGCSASYTSPLDGRCPGATDPDRSWANATAGDAPAG